MKYVFLINTLFCFLNFLKHLDDGGWLGWLVASIAWILGFMQNKKDNSMSEIKDFETFHPRAVKLLRKRKNFIVIAEDEKYYHDVYRIIRKNEIENGRWSNEDEIIYQSTQPSPRSDWLPCGHHKDAIAGDGVTEWCFACENAKR